MWVDNMAAQRASRPKAATAIEKMTILDYISFTWKVPFLCKSSVCLITSLHGILCSHGPVSLWFFKYWSKRFSGRPIAALNRRQLLVVTYLQSIRDIMNLRQTEGLSQTSPSGLRIQQFCEKKGLKLETVNIYASPFPDAGLHFITPKDVPTPREGKPESSRMVLYCHGGGYHNPILENGHIPFALDITAASKSHELVMLEYSLAPEHPYPCQLVQGIAVLLYLLEKKKVPARDIVLAGDSAGAHLILGLLTHIVSPAPFAPAIKFETQESFCAAVLVSPWVSMTGEEPSIRANERDDYISKERLLEFVDYLDGDLDDIWFNPWEGLDAKIVWDRVIPPKDILVTATWKPKPLINRLLVTVGTSEILLDSILKFSRQFLKCESVRVDTEGDTKQLKQLRDGKGQDRTTSNTASLAVVSGDVHVQPGLDHAVRYRKGLMARAVRRFLEGI
jgi:acetyl esterase/lipase